MVTLPYNADPKLDTLPASKKGVSLDTCRPNTLPVKNQSQLARLCRMSSGSTHGKPEPLCRQQPHVALPQCCTPSPRIEKDWSMWANSKSKRSQCLVNVFQVRQDLPWCHKLDISWKIIEYPNSPNIQSPDRRKGHLQKLSRSCLEGVGKLESCCDSPMLQAQRIYKVKSQKYLKIKLDCEEV